MPDFPSPSPTTPFSSATTPTGATTLTSPTTSASASAFSNATAAVTVSSLASPLTGLLGGFTDRLDVLALAGWTRRRTTGPKRLFPYVPAVQTLKYSHLSHLYFSSFDSYGKSLDQGRRHLFPCGIDNPAECLPRYAHLSCRLLLVLPQMVSEPKGFELVNRQVHLRKRPGRHSSRFEQAAAWVGGDFSAAFWSSHVISPTCNYGHMLIKCQGQRLLLNLTTEISDFVSRTMDVARDDNSYPRDGYRNARFAGCENSPDWGGRSGIRGRYNPGTDSVS